MKGSLNGTIWNDASSFNNNNKEKSYCTSALSCTYVDKGGVDVLFIWIRGPQEHPSTVHCSIKRETTVNNQKYI